MNNRELTEPIFRALIDLQRNLPGPQQPAAAPDALNRRLCDLLDDCARKATAAGVSAADCDHLRYALVALIDEVALAQPGALRDFWVDNLLQMRFFGENCAGERFYERLTTLRRDPTRIEIVRVYYLCLSLGFKGKHGVRGGEIELLDLAEQLREELMRAQLAPREIALSPSAARPYEPMADQRRNFLLLSISGAAALVSVLLYFGLRLTLVARADQLIERLSGLIGA